MKRTIDALMTPWTPFLLVNAIIALTAIAILTPSCASIAPGADPLVVRVEQTEQSAYSTFKTVLLIDNANRDFFRTNAATFHQLCQWLRQPVPYPPGNTNSIPRDLALVLSLNAVKDAYQSGTATSNEVVTALTTLSAVLDEAFFWSTNVALIHP